MGGDFFLWVQDKRAFEAIDASAWRNLMLELPERFGDWEDLVAMGCEVSFDKGDKAFEFRDKVTWTSGERKSFSLPKVLDFNQPDGGIVSKLGGRRRTDWRGVRNVIMAVCNRFPGVFRLTVCDGIGGYNDDEGCWYYDGIDGEVRRVWGERAEQVLAFVREDDDGTLKWHWL